MKLLFQIIASFPCFYLLSAAEENPYALPPVEVEGYRVANLEPAFGLSMPVTLLRYEPQVDVMSRNLAESQGDISIRGGIFENTGIILGAVTLFDPQTGHYLAEIPVPAQMLYPPKILTGFDNALAGFNSSAGSVLLSWNEVRSNSDIKAFFGSQGLNRQSLYTGYDQPWRDLNIAGDLSFSRSESNGLVRNGDHQFERYAGRLQLKTAKTQTDLFAGYQSKFFGWPYLYAPAELHESVTAFGASGTGAETENLQTRLFLINHRYNYTGNDSIEITAYFRKHTDDYEFDRFVPDLFNPFEHESKVWSLGLKGQQQIDSNFGIEYAAQALKDNLTSSNLSFASFSGPVIDGFSETARGYYKFTLQPQWQEDDWKVRAGLSIDSTSEDGTAASPMVEVRWLPATLSLQVYAQYAEATQVPGYTALAASPMSGLFRGNPLLGREKSRNYELGAEWQDNSLRIKAAAFFREDRDLVDWTLSSNSQAASRVANALEINTTGFELKGGYQVKNTEVILGYTYINKDSDDTEAPLGSFYALNFARHRLTLSLRAKLIQNLEIRLDNELRIQEPNILRDGTRRPFFTTVTLAWEVPKIEGLQLEAIIENLWNIEYEEIPSVPGTPIHAAAGAVFRF